MKWNKSPQGIQLVEYSSKIGYNAHKMADFFKILNKMNIKNFGSAMISFGKLNDLELTDKVQAGMLIKIVGDQEGGHIYHHIKP